MTAVYTAPHYTFQEARGGSGLLRLAAKYEFLRVVRAECGQKVFNSSSGQLSLRSLGSVFCSGVCSRACRRGPAACSPPSKPAHTLFSSFPSHLT